MYRKHTLLQRNHFVALIQHNLQTHTTSLPRFQEACSSESYIILQDKDQTAQNTAERSPKSFTRDLLLFYDLSLKMLTIVSVSTVKLAQDLTEEIFGLHIFSF